jgi:tetratricopeptide (TPR) repeat protein
MSRSMSTNISSALDSDLQVAVPEQLARILDDGQFISSERSSRFLRFVVERTLAGRAAEIKELVIAAELYERADTYDPKADSTVRVEASRVRAKLERYYTRNGVRDPIRITIPRGAYVPQFERVAADRPSLEGGAESDDRTPPLLSARRARVLVGPWTLLLMLGTGITLAWPLWRAAVVDAARDVTAARAAQVDPEALAAWREGNELLRHDPHSGLSEHGMPRMLARAIERYEVAVARSPAFARGWASLAEGYEYASAFVGRNQAEDTRRAEEAARRAISLEPGLPEGHAMLAMVLFYLRWDFAGAEAAYRRAIELDPRAAWAIVEYVDLLRETHRLGEAASEIRRARMLQPALPVLAVKEAEVLLDQGRAEEAIAAATAAIGLKHDSRRAYVVLGMAREASGEPEQALPHYQRALEMNPQDRRALPALGYLLGRLGRRDEARAVLRTLGEINDRVRSCAYQIAVVHVGLGEHDHALSWLERAVDRRQMHAPFMVVESRFRDLRSHPRFRALVERLGLPRPANRPTST